MVREKNNYGGILNKSTHGYTLVELLITIAIAMALLSIVLYDYVGFNDKQALSAAAQEMVLAIRQAQSYGINVRETSMGTNDFSKSYGIYFNPSSSPNDYYLFVDKNGDRKYNDTIGSCSGTECVEKVTFRNGVTVSSISISGSTCPSDNLATSLTVTFLRPNPDATMTFANSSGSTVCTSQSLNGQATLRSRNGLTKIVGVDPTGQIYIQ